MKRIALSLAVAGGVFLTGCGGGAGGDPSDNNNGGNTPLPQTRSDVVGPLDAIQGPLSSQVLAPIAQAMAGTPMVGMLNCVDQMVVEDMLDVADRFALALQPGAAGSPAAFQAAAANVQAELGDFANDLQGFITSLAAAGGCNSNAAPLPSAGGNPLAGTSLASLGSTLPLISQLQAQLNGVGGASPTSLSPAQLSALITQLDAALDQAFASIPAEARNAPMVGPSLLMVQEMVSDMQLLLSEAASNDTAGVQSAVTAMVDRMMGNMLTGLVPLGQIETVSGDPGAISGQVQSAIDQFMSVFAGGVRTQPSSVFGASLASAFDPLINPFEANILDAILGPIDLAIPAGGVPATPGLPTGTALDGVLAPITAVLTGAGTGGNPLQALLGSLLGGTGGVASCPLAGGPLAALCGILSV